LIHKIDDQQPCLSSKFSIVAQEIAYPLPPARTIHVKQKGLKMSDKVSPKPDARREID